MASISSLGVGSGLDIRSLVDDLVAAERAPKENRLNRQQERYETELSGLGQVSSALNDFRGKVSELSDIDAFRQIDASSSDDAIEVSADSDAETGRFDIGVNQLAQAQGVASGAFADRSSAVGSGTLTFRFGDVQTDADGNVSGFTENTERGAVDIQIPEDANTLQDVRDAVNDADIGVRASIINDGSGERLTFSAADTGAENGFIVEAADADGNNTDGAGLSRLAYNADATNLEQTREARDAQLTVDGLTVTRSSNTVDDLIDGVTLDLRGTTEAASQVEISENRDGARKQIEGFVEAYNGFQSALNKLTSYDAENDEAGPLNGNALVRGIQTSLRNTISETIPELEGSGVRSLADLGILTNRDGTLDLDSARLDEALENNFDEVGALFAPVGLTDGAQDLEYVSSRSATEPGRYGVAVDATATRGRLAGDAIGEPIEITDGNDRLRFEVDGVRTAALDLTQGSYTRDELAAEIQSRINGDSALREAGISVSVAVDGNGALEITSSRYGSESSVAVVETDTTTADTLGFADGDRAEGTDVQGRIGGQEAEGFGRLLTGLEGSGAEGLKLDIGGQATGDRGEVVFSRGLMGQLERQIDGFIGARGSITSSTESLNNRLSGLEEDRLRLDDRMQQVERRYTEQFSAMDSLVAELNETSNFLSQNLGGGGGLSGL